MSKINAESLLFCKSGGTCAAGVGWRPFIEDQISLHIYLFDLPTKIKVLESDNALKRLKKPRLFPRTLIDFTIKLS